MTKSVETIEFWSKIRADKGRDDVLAQGVSSPNESIALVAQAALDKYDQEQVDARNSLIDKRELKTLRVAQNARIAAWVAAVASVLLVLITIFKDG